jgi:hypothetical protein
MASLAEIIQDPNYVNANAATKKAIFDKYAPLDPNYTKANASTQEAIRVKFGVAQPRAAEPEGMPTGPRATPPAWASEYPGLYKAAVATRQLVGPTVEMVGGVLGGAGGATAGTFGAGPFGTAVGGITGAGLGYGTAKQGLRAVDVALGLVPPDTLAGEFQRAGGGVVEGTTYEVGGRLAAPIINKLVQAGVSGAGKLMDLGQLPNQLAAKTAREALGGPEQVAAARTALQAAGAEGLTAQQALARGGVISPSAQATLEKTIKKSGELGKQAPVDTRAAIQARQEAARKSTIEGVTPDLKKAEDIRQKAADPFYKAADKAVVPIDDELAAIFERMPDGTLAAAAKLAKMDGRPFIMGQTSPPKMVKTGMLDAAGKPLMREMPAEQAQITGESLHYIKRALGDIAYGTPTTDFGRDAQRAARNLIKDYIKVFETKVPEYGQARTIFAEKSAPVNQAQVLKEMVSVLEKPGGGERIGPFLNVLGRGEQALLKRAGGRGEPRFESLDEVLTPEQIAKVREVAKQLETEAAIGQQISAGQQRATELLRDELPNYRLPNIFNVFATTANRVLDTLGVRVGKKTIEKMAEASLSAKSFDELLATLPGNERSKVLKAIGDPDTWANIKPAVPKAAMGVGGAIQNPEMPPINNLAPQAPANALTR